MVHAHGVLNQSRPLIYLSWPVFSDVFRSHNNHFPKQQSIMSIFNLHDSEGLSERCWAHKGTARNTTSTLPRVGMQDLKGLKRRVRGSCGLSNTRHHSHCPTLSLRLRVHCEENKYWCLALCFLATLSSPLPYSSALLPYLKSFFTTLSCSVLPCCLSIHHFYNY